MMQGIESRVDAYARLAARVREPAPPVEAVLRGSLPVVSFGNSLSATTATVSLNPSWIEFQSKAGLWLLGNKRRLASLISLGVPDHRDLDEQAVASVIEDSNGYFEGPNWYRGWFHWLETLLTTSADASYLTGSACHLDLVQWATKPAQSKVPTSEWKHLMDADSEFLHWQLSAHAIQRVLVNGASCATWMRNAGLVRHWDTEVLEFQAASGKPRRLLVQRSDEGGVTYLSWSTPLAQAIPATGRALLGAWVQGQLHR